MLQYYLITFIISWGCWITAAIMQWDVTTLPGIIPMYLGGLGPFIAALFLNFTNKDKEAQRDFWRRIFDFRKISGGWYAVIFFTIPLISLLAITMAYWRTGETTQMYDLQSILTQPLSFLVFIVTAFFFGPVPEELGWRGIALDQLQEKFSALISSFILGGVWALWHLPLFFMNGTYQNKIGFGSADFWMFNLLLLPITILMTWIYNHTGRSILSAILFHFMVNLSGQFFGIEGVARIYQFNLLFIMTALVVLLYGEKTLNDKPDVDKLLRRDE